MLFFPLCPSLVSSPIPEVTEANEVLQVRQLYSLTSYVTTQVRKNSKPSFGVAIHLWYIRTEAMSGSHFQITGGVASQGPNRYANVSILSATQLRLAAHANVRQIQLDPDHHESRHDFYCRLATRSLPVNEDKHCAVSVPFSGAEHATFQQPLTLSPHIPGQRGSSQPVALVFDSPLFPATTGVVADCDSSHIHTCISLSDFSLAYAFPSTYILLISSKRWEPAT